MGDAAGGSLSRTRRWAALAVLAATAGYAWWATGLRPFTRPSLAAVLGAGVVAMGLGAAALPVPAAPPPAPRRHAALWAGLGAAVGLWQLANFVRHPRAEHPTLSSLANTVFESRPARALGFLTWLVAAAALATVPRARIGRPLVLGAWLWLGWHVFVRGDYL